MMKKLFLTGLVSFGLTGCLGYEPMFSQSHTSVMNVSVGDVEMKQVGYGDADRRSAQILNQRLSRSFTSEALEAHTVNVSVEEQRSTLAVARDASEERAELDLVASVSLKDAKGLVIFKTQVTTSAPYNIEDSPYATDSGIERARLSAVQVLSDEIVHRISFYFYNRKQG